MCLEKVDKEPQYPNEGEGYQVIRIDGAGNYFSLFNYFNKHFFSIKKPIKKWLKANAPFIFTYNKKFYYKAGFHIYPTKEFAQKELDSWTLTRKMKIIKLKYRQLICTGVQALGAEKIPCIVAEEIYISE